MLDAGGNEAARNRAHFAIERRECVTRTSLVNERVTIGQGARQHRQQLADSDVAIRRLNHARIVTYTESPMNPCTVLIGGPDVLPALKKRASSFKGELLAFTDADALIALEVITKRRPKVVALEKVFASTARGTALINRIKADPALEHAEIRVIAHDNDSERVIARGPAAVQEGKGTGGGTAAATAATPKVAPLDQRGTRRAPRFKIAGQVDVVIDGNTAVLVDLSTIGAQVVSTVVLKPNQRVRMALADDSGNVRFNAVVAWASFEIPPKMGPRYRAGLAFVDAEAAGVDAFRARHQQN